MVPNPNPFAILPSATEVGDILTAGLPPDAAAVGQDEYCVAAALC